MGSTGGCRLRAAAATICCSQHSGQISGLADLSILSLTLIYFALWAVNARPATDPMALLSLRMSIAHFAVLAFCWMIWRTAFFYCGLYTWQHLQSVQGVAGRVLLATGLCALVEAQIIAVQWHHGHFLRILLMHGLLLRFACLLRGWRSVHLMSTCGHFSAKAEMQSLSGAAQGPYASAMN